MIKNVDDSFDDYCISRMIRHVLPHWGYELVENNLKWFICCSCKNELLSVK